jgi:3-demethoxyubiquinol 3-hydroxylase
MKDEWIRVNLAGERGARAIYAGQLWVLKQNRNLDGESQASAEAEAIIHIIQEMDDQEGNHVVWFEELGRARQIRPSFLQPFWNAGGFALGALTAWMGKETAMACTQAVETIIDQHYEDQIQMLKKDGESSENEEILKILKKCQQDEQEHKETARAHHAESAHPLVFHGICSLTSLAIYLARKI